MLPATFPVNRAVVHGPLIVHVRSSLIPFIHSFQSVRIPSSLDLYLGIASHSLIRPLYQASSGQWRALSAGTPVSPSAAFSYITRTLLQTTPQIVGALRVLGASYSPAELNGKGYSLYAKFRPEVDGWGKRSEVNCSTVLGLRKVDDGENKEGDGENSSPDKAVKIQSMNGAEDKTADDYQTTEVKGPDRKKARGMTLEEYEAALDVDNTFNDLDLGDLPGDAVTATDMKPQ